MTLASIQKIDEVFPIEGADRIEGVNILGWKCVVKKGIFKKNNLCVYIEIDTIIPKKLLSDNPEDIEMVRLRTVKMKGQISQGLVLPIDILLNFGFEEDGDEWAGGYVTNKELDLSYEYWYHEKNPEWAGIGEDLTDILGIKKYEKAIPAQLQGLVKGDFPGFLRKTDEVKIQSEPKLLDFIKGKPYYITTKLDGTSATYYKFNEEFGVCSRNMELKESEGNVYWKMVDKYKIDEWLPEGYAIQGEIVGPGIQKNPLDLKDLELYIFNVFDIHNQKYCYFIQWITNVEYNNFKYVPNEESGNEFNYTLEELLEKAKGKYLNTNHNKEGIVVRSIDQSISFKVVNNDYLLKDEE